MSALPNIIEDHEHVLFLAGQRCQNVRGTLGAEEGRVNPGESTGMLRVAGAV